jgi:hypothetical protein
VSNVTHICDRARQGDPQAAAELLPLIYEELRTVATMRMAKEPPDQTLQATALVNEDWPRVTGNADQAAGEAENHGFEEELAEDVAGAGTHRHSDADFAGPLRDAHEHDVHDGALAPV